MEKRLHLTKCLVTLLLTLSLFSPAALLAQASGPVLEKPLSEHVIEQFGEPPTVPQGPLSPALQFAARVAFIDSTTLRTWDKNQELALAAIGKSKDPRLAWIVSDMLRFAATQKPVIALARTASELLGKDFDTENTWHDVTNHLLAWNIPAPPDYLDYKRAIFTINIPGWEKLFIAGDIDWRLVSWGGVLIDNRTYNTTDDGCNCIPAVDNPEVSTAEDATWLKDEDIIFGIEVNGESRAYPRRIMEVREMVNDTLGGRDLGIPYCTLCGAAQAYFTDQLPEGIERPVLRTSGLLSRSNKVMYDLNTYSIFDTFIGRAVNGPLAEKELALKQTSVITTDWGTWKREHPQTTVLLERYALGRNPDFRNGRDANGPIFPVGDIDPRLPVHEDVIGAITASGIPVAFPRATAYIALSRGENVSFENIQLELTAGGIKAVDKSGPDASGNDASSNNTSSHQAFWFAWSQFYPQTKLWMP